MNTLIDITAERALLAGLIKYGSFAYHEISTLDLSDASFSEESHKVIYKCLNKVFSSIENVKVDIPLIYSAAADIGLKYYFQKDEEVQYLVSLTTFPVKDENVLVFGRKVKKLEIIRNIIDRLTNTSDRLYEFDGNESINEIFGVVEENIIDCASFLSVEEMGITLLSEGIDEYFKDLEENPIEQVGLSTGMPIYDAAIGGGLRNGSVNMICARPGIGKSTLCLNISKHIAENGIPVLILDTEMTKEDSWHRLVSSISEIKNKNVETGKYTKFLSEKNKVHSAIEKVKILPIYYTSIAGQSLESQISIIKRWLITTVGLNKDGTVKPCLIAYDYLKIMDKEDIKNLKEYQLVGFLVSSLIDFAKKYKFPVLAFAQLNRDGINKEDTSIISMSDRMLWFCSSMSIFKTKSFDEMDRDGWDNGNRKLKVLKSRYGSGMQEMEYVNCNFNGAISRITEGKTNFELDKEGKIKKKEEKIKLEESEQEKSNSDEQIQFR